MKLSCCQARFPVTIKGYKCIDGTNGGATDVFTLSRGACLKRAWQHDYFTSALPWTQKGPEATIPLGTSAPITFTNTTTDTLHISGTFPSNAGNWDQEVFGQFAGESSGITQVDLGGGSRVESRLDNSANLSTDLTAATAATINDLRSAIRS